MPVASDGPNIAPVRCGFSAARDAAKIDKSLVQGENVMLHTARMIPADVAALKAEDAARNQGKVACWP